MVDMVIKRRKLHGGMECGCRRSSDHQRRVHASGLHVPAYLFHLVEGRGDETADRYDVCTDLHRLFDDRLLVDHDSEIMDVESIAGKDDSGDVLSDVMNVALDGRDDHFRTARLLVVVAHERFENIHGVSHDLRRFHHLRQEHLAFAEEGSDGFHARHQRAFNDRKGSSVFIQSLLKVGFEVFRAAFDESGLEAFCNRCCCAVVLCIFISLQIVLLSGLSGHLSRQLHQSLRCLRVGIEYYILHALEQLRLDFVIDLKH